MADAVASSPLTRIFALRGWLTRGLGVPVMLLVMLSMMVVPLPPIALDAFFSFNIALAIAILLAVIYVMRPLDFTAFPTVLLMVTLLRLALNVASTRVVLLEGHTGPDAAGQVIQAFGEFVIGGDYAVGLVVFAIITLINFVVVTKGAERISEVSARFTLDALPGKQMAIDADLNAGSLTREEAAARREEVRQEADFYGSMDGASKFVRGDAIAGLLILFINIFGGLAIGMLQRGLPAGEALQVYTLLTIGDGLVAQVPALLLSTSVAILVTRMSQPQDMSAQMVGQLFSSPRTLLVTAGVLLVLGLIPGMPNLAFLTLAAAAGGAAYLLHRRRQAETLRQNEPVDSGPQTPRELGWDDVAADDVIGLEVGYKLIPLADSRQGGELMGRVKGVRKKLTRELGFLMHPVHIRDDLSLPPEGYRIAIHGVPVAAGEVRVDREMALNPGQVFGPVEGIETRDPAFGLPAYWIEPGQRDSAQENGWTVVDPTTVIATHLSQALRTHAAELLGHDEVQHLLDNLARAAPRLVEDLVPKLLPLSVVVKVLGSLLEEGVSVRNMRGIAEALAAQGGASQDPVTLTAAVRVALGRQIVQEINGMEAELPVATLAEPLERMLHQSLQDSQHAIEPGLAERMHDALKQFTQRQETAGRPAVLLVPAGLRGMLARFIRNSVKGLHVLAYNEIPPDRQIRMTDSVTG
ncbi:flagellar biosynthesis protein FlhA [Spectribacter hydrogenoxidans]|uniref:Flagellar biosynthesis protein FlhA n=1 Tax=Spectribacter hydrogenoxidans TaxID=3075608 RepID=A0ABU3BVP6_9GAMM|nr:flagellar biosynthesis protein FlhA [Salinisphaera sp. W335]MDT0633369.1 flagellar biosynthesis protein FlhA [Salinisphaera sp. W335]